MSKAGQRRIRNLARYLSNMLVRDEEQFKREWHLRLNSWLQEINRRGQALASTAREREMRIFAVLEQVERLLALCGPEVDRLVGVYTRDTLSHECSKVFALAVAPEMSRRRLKS